MKILIWVALLGLCSFANAVEQNYNNMSVENDKIVACNFHGTRSEGWYAYPIDSEISLHEGQCDFDYKPECIDLADGTQGWLIEGRTFPVSGTGCADLDVVCSYKGTASEGWYAYPSQQRSLVAYSFCADK